MSVLNKGVPKLVSACIYIYIQRKHPKLLNATQAAYEYADVPQIM